MQNRRKNPRYPIKLRIYFPEEGIVGLTENISIDGCYIKTDARVTVGLVKDILMEIPVLGVIALKGYVQHVEESQKGMGIQLVKVRFATDQDVFYSFFTKFIECLQTLDRLHEKYVDLALLSKIKLYTFPKDALKKFN